MASTGFAVSAVRMRPGEAAVVEVAEVGAPPINDGGAEQPGPGNETDDSEHEPTFAAGLSGDPRYVTWMNEMDLRIPESAPGQ